MKYHSFRLFTQWFEHSYCVNFDCMPILLIYDTQLVKLFGVDRDRKNVFGVNLGQILMLVVVDFLVSFSSIKQDNL